MLEVEVKVKIDIADVEPMLTELGFHKESTVYEYDTYYNGEKTNLKASDKALRIREHKNMDTNKVKYVMNFKGPKIDKLTMTREETQFEIPSLEAGTILLNGLGFYAAGNVEKLRVHYRRADVVCCLDTVTGLGDYLEIEIMSDETGYDNAVRRIEELLIDMGLDIKETIRESYLCLLNKVCES